MALKEASMKARKIGKEMNHPSSHVSTTLLVNNFHFVLGTQGREIEKDNGKNCSDKFLQHYIKMNKSWAGQTRGFSSFFFFSPFYTSMEIYIHICKHIY